MTHRHLIIVILSAFSLVVFGQAEQSDSIGKESFFSGAELSIQVQGGLGTGTYAPLWISNNHYGSVSPYANSANERIALLRSIDSDSLRQWRWGYGLDLQLLQNAENKFFVQQAFVELKWKKLQFTLGSKERQIELRNNRLTLGSMTQGINARPNPMAMLQTDYVAFPGTSGWLSFKGRTGYGLVLDGDWQKEWVDKSVSTYTSNRRINENVAYMKIGKEPRFPMCFELGVHAITLFEGNNHNTIGSINSALTFDLGTWLIRGYFDHYLENMSQFFRWHGIKDHLFGIEVSFPKNRFVKSFVMEHFGTNGQHISDSFYNDENGLGWHSWGMSMGNPMILSPIYTINNGQHILYFQDNQVTAWHLALEGQPSDEIDWLVKYSFSKNFGERNNEYPGSIHQTYFVAECGYKPHWLPGWYGRVAVGVDHAKLFNKSFGAMLTVRRSFKLCR